MPSSTMRRLLGGMTVIGAAFFGLTCGNNLVEFGSGNPGTLARYVAITGMTAGASMVGIDFRPADGHLYGVGSDSRVYTIDTLTGAVASSDPALAFVAGDPNAGGNAAISTLAYRETGGGSTLLAVDATANTGAATRLGNIGPAVHSLAVAP